MVSVLNSGVRCASVMPGGHPVTAVYQPVVLSVITTLVMPRQGSVPAPMGTQVCVIAFFHTVYGRHGGLALVVWKVENSIHQINHYPAHCRVCFINIYPLGSDLSSGVIELRSWARLSFQLFALENFPCVSQMLGCMLLCLKDCLIMLTFTGDNRINLVACDF